MRSIFVHHNVRAAATLAAFCLITACDRERRETSAPVRETPADNASTSPHDVPPDDRVPASSTLERSADSDRVIAVRAVIAALPTQYSASFTAQGLQLIDETRESATGQARGRYEFYGARLMRYSGEAVLEPVSVSLEFDTRGALVSNTTLAPEALAAIKNRGQLLRSHALAQLAARSH